MNASLRPQPPRRQPISVLPDDLASQIAAGEVVERPSSVVKELIENALDAGAHRVEVQIEAGGIALIEVSDDGSGMHPDDAELSLQRHATSKLRAFSDLDALASYGFRGEALPSIASVSRLQIVSRHLSQDAGLCLEAEGTTRPKKAPCARPVGTTISVRDLFYNVPARRKFLRSSNTESGHVSEVLQDAALARPDVSFRLVRDGKKVRYFERVPDRRKRVEQVTDEDALLRIDGQRGPVAVEAFLAPLERARRGAQGLKLLINGRPIKDRALAATVAHAFGPALEKGRYPRGVIYLEVPRRLVDINVHPQKTEVRFADARAMCDALYSIVARGLSSPSRGQGGWPGRAFSGSQPSSDSSRADASLAPAGLPSRGEGGNQETQVERAASTAERSSVAGDPEGGTQALLLEGERAPVSGQRYAAAPSASVTRSRVQGGGPDRRADRKGELDAAAAQVGEALRSAERSGRALRLLGQAQDAYLVCQNNQGICILDQHAADEISTFLRLEQAYRSGGLQSQALLFPTVLKLNKRDTELLERRAALLLRLGLDVRVRAEGSASLHGILGALKRATPELTIEAFIGAARSFKDEGDVVRAFLSSLACHEAIPRGTSLSLGDAGVILKGLSGVDLEQGIEHCKHGRPLLSVTPFSELTRKAER